jgi:hypothetical protein
MARVQQPQKNSKPVAKTQASKNPKGKQELAKTNPKREPSKNEILFFRIGLMVIALTIITVTIIFIIQYFMDKEEEKGIFDDYTHITASDLRYLTYNHGDSTYGMFDFFMGKEQYEDLYQAITDNNYIYVYFYRASDLNDSIVEQIKAMDLEGKAFFLINLDTADGQSVFTNGELSHLNLDQSRQQMLLTFDVDGANPQTFRLDSVANQIRITLNTIN